MNQVTIFRNIFDKEPHYIPVDKCLERIKTGKSMELISNIRQQLDKERADKLKANLPSVCFSGKFKERKDECILEHSGFIVLDFDEVHELRDKQTEIISQPFVYACWISPRGNGLKTLIRIAEGKKHREHFHALKELFPDADKSGINESRVCYESYDPEIYINTNATAFKKIKILERIEVTEILNDEQKVFENILKWLSNKGDAFTTGERNNFIFKLASACCRFGINEETCLYLSNTAFLANDNSFSRSECKRTVQSAYRANKNKFATAQFDRDILVEKVTRKEIKFDEAIYDVSIRPKDVIFGEDVKAEALEIYEHGYPHIEPLNIPILDKLFKFKKSEITLISGIGNYGKSSFLRFLLILRTILYNEKFALFTPEDNPAQEFYHDCVETLLGLDCTPQNLFRISKVVYERAYDFISKYMFYVYPKELAPTPEYIKERFLELIIKEEVSGVVIDPFNQLANNYSGAGGRSDKYLETFLADYARFNQINNTFGLLIAHPHKLRKEADGSYPCPDVFDLADGAMWNNKMDNILIYHRPNHQKDPMSSVCELHSKKIRRQKIVGIKGTISFEYVKKMRRYFFDGADVLQQALNKKGISFEFDPNKNLEDAPF